jgi:hypothetical protein
MSVMGEWIGESLDGAGRLVNNWAIEAVTLR